MSEPLRGLTVRDVARRYRVNPDKVRGWIKRGELRAVNTASAMCRKPRFVVPPDALPEFEQRRAGTLPPKPTRRRKTAASRDWFPEITAPGGTV
jgi:hypothetical protein